MKSHVHFKVTLCRGCTAAASCTALTARDALQWHVPDTSNLKMQKSYQTLGIHKFKFPSAILTFSTNTVWDESSDSHSVPNGCSNSWYSLPSMFDLGRSHIVLNLDLCFWGLRKGRPLFYGTCSPQPLLNILYINRNPLCSYRPQLPRS